MHDSPDIAQHPSPAPWPHSLVIATLLLVLLGIGWRTFRYLERFPVWGDEAFVCLNLLDRDYLGLLRPLRFSQVAPVLFLWSERTVHVVLGDSELSVRLLPFLAGVATLGLFWRLVRRSLSPLAGAVAVGVLAVSYYPVRHCCEVKPYAFDLLAAVALLLPAVAWLGNTRRRRWPLLLTLLLPIVLGLSYPAVFIAGAISVALLPVAGRERDWRLRGMFLAYNIVLLCSFAGWYLVAGLGQFTSTHGTENVQWDMCFPPAQPWELVKWLVAAHTGNMFAYPVGSRDGGSLIATLLCVGGAWQLARSRRWELLLLCLMPFVLTLLAAALHRYPYGGSARVAQHLAPLICLLMGNGVAWFRTIMENRKWRIANGWNRFLNFPFSIFRFPFFACLLAIVGLTGLLRDAVRPYKTPGDHEARRLAGTIARRAGPDDQVVVLNEDWRLPPGMEWYLRLHGVRVFWNGLVDEQRLAKSTRQVWVLSFPGTPQRWNDFVLRLRRNPRTFLVSRQADYRLPFGWDLAHGDQCRLLYLVAEDESSSESGVITAEGDARSNGSGLVPAALDKRP